MIWNPITEPQDWVDFAGRATPGIAEIVGAGTPRRWDERESYGLSGAVVVYHGLKLSHFSVMVRLYNEQDWEDWFAFKPIVDKVPVGRRQKAIAITHPQLAMLGIKAVVVEDVLQPEQIDDGVWQIEIKLIEYRAPYTALAKPEGAEATPGDPEDPEISELDNQASALATEPTP